MSGNVFQNSADAMKSILELHFPDGTIIDSTGATGVFYGQVSREVVRGDIRPEVDPDYVGDFREIPFEDDSFDLGVFDPPYKRGSRNRKSKDYYVPRYGKAPNNENAATRQYFEGLPELFRVARSGVIAKLQDAADGHHFHDRRFLVAQFIYEKFKLRVHDVAVVYRKSPISTLTSGKRHYLRQQVSYFLVWKFKRKNPFIRFGY